MPLKILLGKSRFDGSFILCRNNYATFQSIKTNTIEVTDKKTGLKAKKAKLFITLEKHADFDANMEKFNKIKEENEAIAKKTEQTP